MIACKSLVEPTEKIEDLLIRPRSTVLWMEAVQILQDAAPPFMKVEQFFQELMSLHKLYVPKPAKRARSSV